MNIDEHRCPPRAFLEEIFAKSHCGIRCVDDNLPRPCWHCLPKHRQCGHRKAQNPLAPQSSQLRKRPSATLCPGTNLQKSRRDTLNDDTMTKCPTWSEQLCASCIALQKLLSFQPSVIGDHGRSPVLACLLALVHRACMENRLASRNINLSEQAHSGRSHNHSVFNTCLYTHLSSHASLHMLQLGCQVPHAEHDLQNPQPVPVEFPRLPIL